ncbi:RHS repeat-associated core domain-containing protein [Serratia fonticola]|uniref:RHS repeat-associated core domain-containing protein n=1 Tax=Serratia fonticola TaxID=47917 RepID=UPI00301D1B4B
MPAARRTAPTAIGGSVRRICTQPLRFQGQYFDAESGLHYNRYRYYSPETARFITPDPIGLAGGLNQTQYGPNPTGWVDLLGLASVKRVPSGLR